MTFYELAQEALFKQPTGRADDQATLTKDEADYTPEGAAVLGVMGVQLEMPNRMAKVRRVLHPSLGSGVWARAIAACYPQDAPCIVGVERRESERPNAIAACPGGVHIMDFEQFIQQPSQEPFDLVIDNIPFTGFPRRDKKRRTNTWGWHIDLLRAGLLADNAIVAFYGLTQMGQGEAAQASMREWSPMLALRYGGRNEHRGEGTERLAPIPKKYLVPGGPTHEMRENGGDSREYTLWVWSVEDHAFRQRRLAGAAGYPDSDLIHELRYKLRSPRWTTVQLPVLPKHLRCWSTDAVPGTRLIPQDTVDTVAALLRGGL